jgi:hypothetical protein
LPSLSPVRVRIRRWWKRPDDHRGRHRNSTELGTSSQPLRWSCDSVSGTGMG